MSLFELTGDRIEPVQRTSFTAERLNERRDLQRLLRDQIEIIAPDTMVLDEEFCDWSDSQRRIDLLCLDRQAKLVVVELKATDDGGHMELQALRYAAMVSTLTFEQAVAAHARYLRNRGRADDARQRILDFLRWESEDPSRFAPDVRIVLVSTDFSKEVTTAVLWLNERDLDIRCVRLRPHRLNGSIVLDVQQIIPLPESAEYQVRVRAKEQEERSSRTPPDYATTWRQMETTLAAPDLGIARELERWFLSSGAYLFVLRSGSGIGVSVTHPTGRECYLCRIGLDGKVQVWFQYLAASTPFSNESMRHELRARLNRIPGVDIPADRIGGKPALPLSILDTPDAMARFKEAWSWVMAQIATDAPERAAPVAVPAT